MSGRDAGNEPSLALVRKVVATLAVLWVVALAAVFALRIAFPLELEWMEGGALQQALRLQRGEAIYGPPSADFVPFLYTPLYPMVLAALGQLFPLDFALGRAVSVLGVGAIGAAVWRAVGQEGKPRAHQLVAVGLCCSGYVFCFRWLDLARADAMCMALALWGLVLLRESWGDWRRAALAGLLMGLAFWTKQTALVLVLASGVAGLLAAPRQLPIYVAAVGLVGVGGVALGQALTEGWMWTYIYELHQSHAFNHVRFTRKTWGMFLHAAPWLALLLGLVLYDTLAPALGKRRRLDDGDASRALIARLRSRKGPGYWGVMALAGLLVSALGYSTQWAEPNAFIPGVLLGAVALAVALPVGGRLEIGALGLVGAQLVFAFFVEPTYQPIQNRGIAALGASYRWQSPWRSVPTRAQRAAASELRAELRAGPGPVLALHRPWWSVLAAHGGHTGHVGSMGLNDLTPEQRREVVGTLRARVEAGHYARIWIEGEPPAWLRPSLARGYRVEQRRWGGARVRPLTGYMSEPGMVTPYTAAQILLVPVTPSSAPPDSELVADLEDGSLRGFEIEGRAFGRRAVGSFHLRQPPIGPIGGAYALSSAATPAGLDARGTARSPIFTLPEGGAVELLLGRAGPTEGLRVTVELVQAPPGDPGTQPLQIPATRWSLAPVRWPVPPAWAGRRARLVFTDDSDAAALFADELRVRAASRR